MIINNNKAQLILFIEMCRALKRKVSQPWPAQIHLDRIFSLSEYGFAVSRLTAPQWTGHISQVLATITVHTFISTISPFGLFFHAAIVAVPAQHLSRFNAEETPRWKQLNERCFRRRTHIFMIRFSCHYFDRNVVVFHGTLTCGVPLSRCIDPSKQTIALKISRKIRKKTRRSKQNGTDRSTKKNFVICAGAYPFQRRTGPHKSYGNTIGPNISSPLDDITDIYRSYLGIRSWSRLLYIRPFVERILCAVRSVNLPKFCWCVRVGSKATKRKERIKKKKKKKQQQNKQPR